MTKSCSHLRFEGKFAKESEIIHVEEINNIDDLVRLMGCKTGALPSVYLRLAVGD